MATTTRKAKAATPATKATPAKPAAEKTEKVEKAPSLGINYLVEQVQAQTGKETTGYALRIILRKLIAEGKLKRGEGRYTFTGPDDPQIAAVVDYIKSGREDADKKARTTKAKGKKAKKTEEVVEEVDLDSELDDDDTEDEDLEAGFDDEDAEADETEEELFEDDDEE